MSVITIPAAESSLWDCRIAARRPAAQQTAQRALRHTGAMLDLRPLPPDCRNGLQECCRAIKFPWHQKASHNRGNQASKVLPDFRHLLCPPTLPRRLPIWRARGQRMVAGNPPRSSTPRRPVCRTNPVWTRLRRWYRHMPGNERTHRGFTISSWLLERCFCGGHTRNHGGLTGPS